MNLEKIFKIFSGHRFTACRMIGLDIKVKKLRGDRRTITEIINDYTEDDIISLTTEERKILLIQESKPVKKMFLDDNA